jgi:hypothetical protein
MNSASGLVSAVWQRRHSAQIEPYDKANMLALAANELSADTIDTNSVH